MNKIGDLIKQCKYKKQRAKKGYCDYDIFEIDTWFLNIMPKMLQELKDHTNSIPQIIIDDYFKEHKMEHLKQGHKSSSYVNKHKDFLGKEFNRKIEEDCLNKWKKILEEMIYYFKESGEETCSKKNEYEQEYLKASEEFRKKYGDFGEKLLTKEELKKCKKSDSYPCKLISDFPEYKDICNKWHEKNKEIEEYRKECKEKSLNLFVKYFDQLWW